MQKATAIVASCFHACILVPWLCQNIMVAESQPQPPWGLNYNSFSCFWGQNLHSSVTAPEKKGKKKKGCFTLKAPGERRKALCSKEETTSSVLWCLQQWQQQSHPEWLMSRQGGCVELSSSPVAELAVGSPRERWAAPIRQGTGGGLRKADCTECSSS